MNLVVVVDEQDTIIRTAKREDVGSGDIVRCAGVFLVNSSGEILLQKRAASKQYFPLQWDCSGGGHVDPGESYEECAARELHEEIGVETRLTPLGKHLFTFSDGRRHYTSFYKGKYDGDLELDPDEVADVRFFSEDDLRELLEKQEGIQPECLFALQRYLT